VSSTTIRYSGVPENSHSRRSGSDDSAANSSDLMLRWRSRLREESAATDTAASDPAPEAAPALAPTRGRASDPAASEPIRFTPGKAKPLDSDRRHNRAYPHPQNPGLLEQPDGFYDWADRRLYLSDGSPDPMTPGAYRYQTRPDLCDLDAPDSDPSSPRYEPEHLRHKPGDTWIIDRSRPYDVLDPGPFGSPGWFPDRRTGRHRRDELPDPIPWWEVEEEHEKAEWAEQAEALWLRRTSISREREAAESAESTARDDCRQPGNSHDDRPDDRTLSSGGRGGPGGPGDPPGRSGTTSPNYPDDPDDHGERGGHGQERDRRGRGDREDPGHRRDYGHRRDRGEFGHRGDQGDRGDRGNHRNYGGNADHDDHGHPRDRNGWNRIDRSSERTGFGGAERVASPSHEPSGFDSSGPDPTVLDAPHRFDKLREDAWARFLERSEPLAAAHHPPVQARSDHHERTPAKHHLLNPWKLWLNLIRALVAVAARSKPVFTQSASKQSISASVPVQRRRPMVAPDRRTHLASRTARFAGAVRGAQRARAETASSPGLAARPAAGPVDGPVSPPKPHIQVHWRTRTRQQRPSPGPAGSFMAEWERHFDLTTGQAAGGAAWA
jgi:hypothetical protein